VICRFVWAHGEWCGAELLPTYWLWLARSAHRPLVNHRKLCVSSSVRCVCPHAWVCGVTRAARPLLMSYAWFNAFYALSVRRSVSRAAAPSTRRHTPLMLTFVYRPARKIYMRRIICVHIRGCARLRPDLVSLATVHSPLLVLNYGETHSRQLK
jgi:hypothetical protein